MEVLLENLGRSFGSQHVIRNLNYRFLPEQGYAILGGNGSGKSTLLRLIQGSLSPSSGLVTYLEAGSPVKPEHIAFKINLAGPYLELIEELTALEFLEFYNKFRKFQDTISPELFLRICLLSDSSDKRIENFSSGMKQRLRLGLALLSNSDLVLLDEPTSNLDPNGVNWYRDLVKKYLKKRCIIIGSNFDEREMDFCEHRLEINPGNNR